ncbi:phage baseplate assembly protein V [Escherichia coli]|nr:phage baseplate assembly protein V [Escherichia coli]EIA2088979.1 phage baseplate assembly protein V [Escherichia coli]EII7053742.1 phage baseplate assembly protein V [Escherichia coli]EIQ9937667.1 phage baseplate assembly protein V [Escherichia coli]EJF6541134.1 phage baseplate assembly protein V [Escherichia coli]
MKVRAHQYDTVDALCWRHYGRTQGVTEQVLKANPGLAEYGPFLPHGLQVELPDIPTTTTVQTAFALPAVYSNQFAPPSTSADACVTEHPDGGWFEYEPATGRWYVRGIKSMVIEAADNITMKTSEFVLEADRTRINSEVVINGGVVESGTYRNANSTYCGTVGQQYTDCHYGFCEIGDCRNGGFCTCGTGYIERTGGGAGE